MSEGTFTGFPARAQATPIPNAFFARLLPELTDPAELGVTLYAFFLLHRKKGYPRFLTYGELAADVRLWLDRLAGRPDVDGEWLFLVGHSEGGYIAPMVAAKDPRVRGVVMLAGPASRLDGGNKSSKRGDRRCHNRRFGCCHRRRTNKDGFTV